MIAMWDAQLAEQDPDIAEALHHEAGAEAFDAMHRLLQRVWVAVAPKIIPGGWLCINIGDATRKFGPDFQLYANHARITEAVLRLGFQQLPGIIWRKPTNSPTKFMGSGMYPAGAYVTLEHEHVLIFRKGGKRTFRTVAEKQQRRRSAYFWEERNRWFSDTWDLRGVGQQLQRKADRERSAAYPMTLPFRLIQMFSIVGDWVFDPFWGTGTTTLAAIASGRNSYGLEIDPALIEGFLEGINTTTAEQLAVWNARRLEKHKAFLAAYTERKGVPKYFNVHHQTPVVTRQELELRLPHLMELEIRNGSLIAHYQAD